MKRSLSLALCALLLTCASCADVLALLPSVLKFVDEAAAVLNGVEFFTHEVLAKHPDSQLQTDADAVLRLARQELEADRATVATIKDPTPEQVEAAFADFYATYQDLLRVTAPLGVRPVALGHATVSTAPGTYAVPDVRAMHWRVSDVPPSPTASIESGYLRAGDALPVIASGTVYAAGTTNAAGASPTHSYSDGCNITTCNDDGLCSSTTAYCPRRRAQ